jgi:hypothetical protein
VWRLDKITLYNEQKGDKLIMPRVKGIEVGAQEESRKTVMASGKIVKDVLGHRVSITAAWDYVPAETIKNLAALLLKNSFLWVEYPSPSGAASGFFEVAYPTMTVFGYKNGEAVWHNVTLEMTAKEVVR